MPLVINKIISRKLVPTLYNVPVRPTLEDLQRENGEQTETTQQIYTRGYEAGYHAALLAVGSKTRVLLDGLANDMPCFVNSSAEVAPQEGMDGL